MTNQKNKFNLRQSILHFSSRFLCCFAILFSITLPFSYEVLPNIGLLLSPLLGKLTYWLGNSVLQLQLPYMGNLASDSSGLYLLTLINIGCALILSLGWVIVFKPKTNDHSFQYWLRVGCAYYIAFQFFQYGFDKIFKSQFYLPEPNTLFTPLGYLSKDILYWSTMGASYSYTVFSGVMEVIPAFLLLFRPTRMLGAFTALLVALHIFMINIGFDISVKLLSSFLFLLCSYIAFPGLKAIYELFTIRQAVKYQPWQAIWIGRQKLIYISTKSLVVFLMLYEALFTHAVTGVFNDDLAPRPFLHGAYEVEQFVINQDTLNHLAWKRFFIHRKGYFITQSAQDNMMDYRLEYHTANTLLLYDYHHQPSLLEYFQDDEYLMLDGNFGGKEVHLMAKSIPLDTLALFQQGFNWTIDSYE